MRERERERERERLAKKNKKILKRIKELRAARNISQMDMAILMHLSFSGYYKLEAGKTRLDSIRLLEILEKLEVKPSAFFKSIE